MTNPTMDFANPPTVTVFGAGVAGLSVAHELAERGLKVVIYEPAESPTEEYSCQVGGMAANQLGRVIDPQAYRELLIESGIKPDAINIPRILLEESASSMRPVQRCFPLTHRIRFKKDPKGDPGWLDHEDEFGTKNRDKLCDVLSKLREAYKEYKRDQEIVNQHLACAKKAAAGESSPADNEVDLELAILQVRILGYTDTDGLPEQNRAESERWTGLVKDKLVKLNEQGPELSIPYLDKRLFTQGRGAEAPLGDQVEKLNRERSNRVEFQIVEQRIPGEHGYRFFPSFYRHLFDTMKRTPVFDKRGDPTPETAYNQLVSTPDPSIGFADGEGLVPVKLRRFTTLRDLQQTIEFFKQKAKFTDRDLLRLQTYFLKYMTSCKERRAAEAEDVSFWQYIGADRVKYSDAAENFINGAPQALVAMSAKETDARSQYNALIQMLVQNPLEEFVPDKTLNASTSEAWLTRWKAYLKLKGVQFYIGRLERLEKSGDEFLPIVSGPNPKFGPIPEYDNSDFDPYDPKRGFDYRNSNFFVMALPFDEASRLVWDAWSQIKGDDGDVRRFTGPFRQLLDFDIFTGRRTSGGAAEPRRRDPRTGQPTNPRDPLRDISGIQYFMPANYRFGNGHVYYFDSPWGLTSISQLAFWRDRIKPIGKMVGQASFDIGNWYAPYTDAPGSRGERPTAWNSTRQELAERTWDQALAAIEKNHARSLVLPQYYHLDQGIRFAIGPLERSGRATTMAAFRASAILKIKSALSGKRYKLDLYGERQAPISVELIPATGNKPEDFRDDLGKAVTRSGIAVAEVLDRDKLIISPLVTTRHALVVVTGASHRKFEVILQGIPFVVDGMHKDEKAIAKALFEAIKHNCPQDCRVAMHGDTTFAIFSKVPPDRHGHDQFSVAVFNADNSIDLVGAPRLTLGLDVPIDPKDGRPAVEIPVESLQNTLPLDNLNPYVINLPGQWMYRPGQRASAGAPGGGAHNFVWYDSPIDSPFRRWIPAGTFMATYTRLTTMEAANESARHAVNTILHKTLQSGFPLSKEQGKLLGDFCEIWDPEDYETRDLAQFKERDETLMREGLPHILDIFRVFELLESLPDDVSLADALEKIRSLAEGQFVSTAAASLIGLNALEGAIRGQIDAMRMILTGGALR